MFLMEAEQPKLYFQAIILILKPDRPQEERSYHYKNVPMQYIEIFKVVKNENFDIFLIFAQNIDCGYLLEPPAKVVLTSTGLNLCFGAKIRKIGKPLHTPCSFTI